MLYLYIIKKENKEEIRRNNFMKDTHKRIMITYTVINTVINCTTRIKYCRTSILNPLLIRLIFKNFSCFIYDGFRVEKRARKRKTKSEAGDKNCARNVVVRDIVQDVTTKVRLIRGLAVVRREGNRRVKRENFRDGNDAKSYI